MSSSYQLADTRSIITPALLVFRELLEENLAKMVALAAPRTGTSERASRLRPHCKTHKMREVTELELGRGITKHKAATFAEAEMLADVDVGDIFLAYNLVGPNIARAVEFVKRFPRVDFTVAADHPRPIAQLGEAMAGAGRRISVALDIDTGQHRTGIQPGAQARDLYAQIARTPGLAPGGLHVYDGHQHQRSFAERAAAINAEWERVMTFRDDLLRGGWAVPRIVAGGTGSFPVYAAKDDPAIELSPGTCVFHDAGYSEQFPDLPFTPAALLLTRVISRPAADLVTLDLGYKAVASDPPAAKRVVFPDLPDAEIVLQNEEHLVIRTARAADFEPGNELPAIPRHICPTVALHREAFVIAGGRVQGTWQVAARDRRLTI